MKAKPLQPWDIRPDESAKAYAAFACYRDMGTGRSVEAVAKGCHKSASLLNRWRQRNDWVARARAWDEHVAALANPKAAQAQADAMARHAQLGRDLQDWARDVLPVAKADAKAPDAIRAADVGVRIEREGLAIPDRAPVDEEGEAVPNVIAIIKASTDGL